VKKIDKVKSLIADKSTFNFDTIKTSSFAAANISVWVSAIEKTYNALLIVDPK